MARVARGPRGGSCTHRFRFIEMEGRARTAPPDRGSWTEGHSSRQRVVLCSSSSLGPPVSSLYDPPQASTQKAAPRYRFSQEAGMMWSGQFLAKKRCYLMWRGGYLSTISPHQAGLMLHRPSPQMAISPLSLHMAISPHQAALMLHIKQP